MLFCRQALLWAAILRCSADARRLQVVGSSTPTFPNTTSSAAPSQSKDIPTTADTRPEKSIAVSSAAASSSTSPSPDSAATSSSTGLGGDSAAASSSSSAQSDDTSTTSCSTLLPGQNPTVWSILPNPTTITITITGNASSTYPTLSEFTPPVYCISTSIAVQTDIPPNATSESTTSTISRFVATPPPTTTTIITTSKNPVTVFTTEVTADIFPGGGTTQKVPVPVIQIPTSTAEPPATFGLPSTVVAPVESVASPTPTTAIASPTPTLIVVSPTPTVIDGVSVHVEQSIAVVGGTTFSIGPQASEQTIVVNQQTISIGSGGVIFAQTTLTPSAQSTNVVIYDADVFSAIGASVAVIGNSTITYSAGSTPQTTVFNGDTITVGPSGIVDGTTTLGGPSNPSGTQLGIAGGISVTQIGSTEAVIDGTTLLVGPGATLTTAVVHGTTITAGPSGLNVANSTTLEYPFNPTTQPVTAGGITFSEIGSSLVVIGTATFTIGPGATPTTDVYNGQTISIGPGGVGFVTTTFGASTPTRTTTAAATQTSAKKNGAGNLRPSGGALGLCIAIGAHFFI